MYYCIYKITDIRNEKVIYIGKTKNFNHRRSMHFTAKEHIGPVDKYMLEEGREYFEMTKLVDNIETNEDAVKLEDQFIVELAPIMNIRRSGHIMKDDPNKYQKEYQKTEKYKEYIQEYKKTEKYKEYQKEYQKTEKYKEYQKEYQKTENYREYRRQYRLKKKLEKQQQIDNQ